MVREWGTPTLFLTFSCAEYDCEDIARYLRKVNDQPSTYPISKLCVEDAISVSRVYSLKFHAFFNLVILKAAVLEVITHHYYKKEYQSRGARHYHILLWIEGAPVIGESDPVSVLKWIQERMTCKIPNVALNPELHNWSQSIRCTNAVRTANVRETLKVHSSPHVSLAFLETALNVPLCTSASSPKRKFTSFHIYHRKLA